jgi:hypothetical protein
MLAQRYQKKMLKCNKNNYKSTKRLIIIKSTDISLDRQASYSVYIYIYIYVHDIIPRFIFLSIHVTTFAILPYTSFVITFIILQQYVLPGEYFLCQENHLYDVECDTISLTVFFNQTHSNCNTEGCYIALKYIIIKRRI